MIELKIAKATNSAIKSSVQKINLVCDLIRGKQVEQAMLQLQFLRKKVAKDISNVLNSAISNAENNFSMDIDRLYINRIEIGKAFMLKRFHARGRGRASGIKKPFSKVTIYLEEKK